MGLFKLFAGKSPADYERKGDAFAHGENWGEAKLAFESALEIESNHPELYYHLGFAHAAAGNQRAAITATDPIENA